MPVAARRGWPSVRTSDVRLLAYEKSPGRPTRPGPRSRLQFFTRMPSSHVAAARGASARYGWIGRHVKRGCRTTPQKPRLNRSTGLIRLDLLPQPVVALLQLRRVRLAEIGRLE